MKYPIIPHFPYGTIREEQKQAIEFALDAFVEEDKKFVILEMGTGCGKSATGWTIADYYNQHIGGNGAYYLTTQKVLQAQYMKDFGSLGMESLESASNYTCKFYKSKNCRESKELLKITKDNKFKQVCGGGCRYTKNKEKFLKGHHGVTNFSYFLAETTYAKQLVKRTMLVIDECHNAELQLGSFVEVAVSEQFASNTLKLKVPELRTQYQVVKWITDIYKPKLYGLKKHYEIMIEKLSMAQRLPEFLKISKQYDLVDKHMCKIQRFLDRYDKDNWVMNEEVSENRKQRKWTFKPIDVAPYSDEYLFGHADKVLMMSATIVDKDAFCTTLGINPDDCAFLSVPSPFPHENHPILVSPVGSMAMSQIDKTLPIMVEAIKAVLAAHPKEKGIIHCNSYKIANYLKKKLRSKRLIFHESHDRDKALAKHMADDRATVLVSPSMQEGVDLKGDLSRFQIVCKVPYPYLGDKLVKKRMHKWQWWYPLQTAKVLIQSVGRSVRSMDDTAITYILDGDWQRFYSKNKALFPENFQKSIQNV
jgi:Rad3-related DNA helicase